MQIGSGVVIGENSKSHAWRIGANVWIGKNCILVRGFAKIVTGRMKVVKYAITVILKMAL